MRTKKLARIFTESVGSIFLDQYWQFRFVDRKSG